MCLAPTPTPGGLEPITSRLGARRYLLLRTVAAQVLWWEVVHNWLGLQGQVRGAGQWVSEVLCWHLDWNLERKGVTGQGPRTASLTLREQLLQPIPPPRVGMTAPGTTRSW